jgi:hypothetical protein
MSGGGSYSESKSSSMNQSTDKGSDVWAAQSPYLKDLYAKAQGNIGMGQQATDLQNQQLGQQYQGLGQFQGNAVDPRMGIYSNQVAQDFSEKIMPQLQGDAILNNGLGNSRNQIAQGIAAGEMNKNMNNFAGQLYGENQNRALQSMGMQNQISGQMGQLPWANLQQYAGLIGGPTMQDLGGSSWGTSKSSSMSTSAKGGVSG